MNILPSFHQLRLVSSAHIFRKELSFCAVFRTETTPELTKPSIKHSGHKMPATPLAPPDFSASGSIEVNIFGMRQMNNEINTVKAQTNFRSVGTLRRMKYLNKHEKYCILAD